ncbi:MAG: DUF362 domain-containing protein [Thermodesulfovibrionales bacterium]|nr:DUF362 domain-containing protein [Thermodesulfovibrionales bacterium]
MNRRDFIKLTAIAGIGLSIPNSIDKFVASVEAAEKADLIVAHGASPSKITRAAIDAMGGMKKFVSKGDIVVVKPNIAWDRTPEQAGNTNPEVVGTVVQLCYEAGAKKVRVFDRPVNDPRRCYVQSGIADVAKAAGADVSYIDERKFKEINIKGEALKSWPLYTDIFEADKVINIPIAKHHGLAKLTMAMKNWMGVMGGSRRTIHQRLDESLVDLSMAIKPTLTILDAVRILTANGPQGGNLSDVKKMDTVIVGVDQVAVDSFGSTLFGMKGSDLGYVKIADQYGLGTMDVSKLNVKRINT